MASRVGDPVKLQEAQEEYSKGQKALSTGAFKWKADYLTAGKLAILVYAIIKCVMFVVVTLLAIDRATFQERCKVV